MTRALITRELACVIRSPAFAAALAVHAALLAAFILLWGEAGGVPLLPKPSLYEQEQVLEWALLAAVLPWTISRCLAYERDDDLVRFSVVSTASPSRILTAKAIAATLVSFAIVASGLPISLVARQMSAGSMTAVFRDLLALAAFGCAAAAITCVCLRRRPAPLDGWIAAGAATIALVAAIAWLPSMARIPALLAIAVGALAALVAGADRRFVYLSERQS